MLGLILDLSIFAGVLFLALYFAGTVMNLVSYFTATPDERKASGLKPYLGFWKSVSLLLTAICATAAAELGLRAMGKFGSARKSNSVPAAAPAAAPAAPSSQVA